MSKAIGVAVMLLAAATNADIGSAAELNEMFDTLEPAYTTMAGAEACRLQLRIGRPLMRYAHMRVRSLEQVSGLSADDLAAKRQIAVEDAKLILTIGACEDVFNAFEILDALRAAAGERYPPAMPDELPTGSRPTGLTNGSASTGAAYRSGLNQLDADHLSQQWIKAYRDCRGGFGDSEKTMQACDRRAELAAELAARGYCETGLVGSHPLWRPCKSIAK